MSINYEELARRYELSVDAMRELITALQRGHGRAAQFNHPELGGMGQWMAGGMIMIGDMNNHALKAKITKICEELSGHTGEMPTAAMPRSSLMTQMVWWPAELGRATMVGEQNNTRYAYFPERHRLVLLKDEVMTTYDTTGYKLTGVSQQQNDNKQNVAFQSDKGTVTVDDLKEV